MRSMTVICGAIVAAFLGMPAVAQTTQTQSYFCHCKGMGAGTFAGMPYTTGPCGNGFIGASIGTTMTVNANELGWLLPNVDQLRLTQNPSTPIYSSVSGWQCRVQ